MEQIETFLTEPWFQIDQQFSLVDILPFAVMLALLILSIAGYLRQKGRFSPAAPPKSAFEKLKSLGAAMIINPLGQVMLFGLAGAYLVLFLLALVATFVLLATVIGWIDGPDGMEEVRSSLGLGALLVALLGAPFLVWRSVVAQQTLDVSKADSRREHQKLVGEQIETAAKRLFASKASKRIGRTVYLTDTNRQDGVLQWHGKSNPHQPKGESFLAQKWEQFDHEEADIGARLLGVEQLDSLAKAEPSERKRILDLVQNHLRETAKNDTAERNPVVTYKALESGDEDSPPMHPEDIFNEFGIDPLDLYPNSKTWADNLRLRPDIQAQLNLLLRAYSDQAGDSLIRRMDEFEKRKENWLDLSRINLQGGNFAGHKLQNVLFTKSRLEGSNFMRADLSRTSFRNAQALGSNFTSAIADRADWVNGQFQVADFTGCKLAGASLIGADLSGAKLGRANFYQCDLREIEILEPVSCQGARFDGSAFKGSNIRFLKLTQAQLDRTFGDYSVNVGELQRPSHWPRENLGRNSFLNAWRNWAAEAHPNVIIAPDWPR